MTNTNASTPSKVSDCWQTPPALFEELNKEFSFEIDLCATAENAKCGLFCLDYLGGIVRETGHSDERLRELGDFLVCGSLGAAFMNPPYSNPKPFIEKAWEDSKHCKIVCLVKCDPSTRWWATFWNYEAGPKPGCEVRFFPKRIKFVPPAGFVGKTSGPSFPSALLIFDRRGVHE